MVMNNADAIGIATQAFKRPDTAHRATVSGAYAQPFVKISTVYHANKTIVNRDIHRMVAGRNHACAARPCNEQVVGNFKILDEPRRNGAATGLDAPGAVKQEHTVSLARQVMRGSGTRRATTDDYHVKRFTLFHTQSPYE